MSTIGERIREARKSKGLNQEELGKLVGVQKAAINKYETGAIVNLKRSKIDALAKALDVTPGWLMGWSETPEIIRLSREYFSLTSMDDRVTAALEKAQEMIDKSKRKYTFQLSTDEYELIQCYCHLNEEHKKMLIEMAHSFTTLEKAGNKDE